MRYTIYLSNVALREPLFGGVTADLASQANYQSRWFIEDESMKANLNADPTEALKLVYISAIHIAGVFIAVIAFLAILAITGEINFLYASGRGAGIWIAVWVYAAVRWHWKCSARP